MSDTPPASTEPRSSTEPPPSPESGRPCVEVPIPPGPDGVQVLMPALAKAMAGTGPAIAPLPAAGSPGYVARLRAALRPGEPVPREVAVVAATSGSTGNPAGVLLPADALRAAAVAFAHRTGAPDGHRWVAALPLQHAGGLMVAVRSVVAGTSPVAVESLGGARAFSLQGFAEATQRAVRLSQVDERPLAVSIVPPMLALLDAAGPTGWDLLCAYDAVLVGGAATPKALADRLLFAGVHLYASYGMTETCGGAVFDGRALTGVTVGRAADGRLTVCGNQVALGYRDGREPEKWSTDLGGRRCFTTDDVGTIAPDGSIHVEGRTDDVAQVGGTSVSVRAVREQLLTDPRVDQAEVVALPDDRWGVSLVAVVVLSGAELSGAELSGAELSGAAPVPDDLADTVGSTLGRAARPRVVHPVAALPMLEAGKPDRAALAELARAALSQAELARAEQPPDPLDPPDPHDPLDPHDSPDPPDHHDSRPPHADRGRIPG